MRLPRPLLLLIVTASCALAGTPATPAPTQDSPTAPQQYSAAPTNDLTAPSAPTALSASIATALPASSAMAKRRAGKTWPWIVAGVLVVGLVIVLVASSGNGGVY